MENINGRRCAACGGALGFVMQTNLVGVGIFPDNKAVSLYQCRDCLRYEFYPPSPLDEAEDEFDAVEAENRRWLEEFQEKVKAGLITAQPFVCPQCGNLRRDRVCPHCGCMVDLQTMKVVGAPEEPGRGGPFGKRDKPDWEL